MQPCGIQALIVFTDPLCLITIDLVHEGLTSELEIAALVARRAGISSSRAAAVLDGLVGIGYAARTGLGTVESLGLDHFGQRLDEAIDHLAWLRAIGDDEQARDCVDAIDAAWNARSSDPERRRQAAHFRRSPAGLRHRARLEARSLGRPFDGSLDGSPVETESGSAP